MGMSQRGIRQAARRLREIGDRAGNLTPAWPGVGGVVAAHMTQQFATAGAAGGRPWKPLNPKYRAWKIRKGFSGDTLIKTGAMRATLTSRPMGIEEYHADHAYFGTRDPKASWHQRGHKRPTPLPKREILFPTDRMQRDITSVLADYIMRGQVRA